MSIVNVNINVGFILKGVLFHEIILFSSSSYNLYLFIHCKHDFELPECVINNARRLDSKLVQRDCL